MASIVFRNSSRRLLRAYFSKLGWQANVIWRIAFFNQLQVYPSWLWRSDLFRASLNVFPIHVPSLRERREDIVMLLDYFLRRYANQAGKVFRSIDKHTLEFFRDYHWPGNIRELQNVVERSVS